MIVGTTIGAVAFLLFTAIVIFYARKFRKRQPNPKTKAESDANPLANTSAAQIFRTKPLPAPSRPRHPDSIMSSNGTSVHGGATELDRGVTFGMPGRRLTELPI